MNPKNYIALNIRHYTNRLLQFKDELEIKIWARSRFEKMAIPPWDRANAHSISAPDSTFSRLFSLNNAAKAEAERIINGELSLFGRTVVSNGDAIKWNKDHLSGKEYPTAVYSSYSIDQDTGADIIVPWELSRLQFIPTLIRAHQLTADQKYANYFFQTVSDWEKANPYLFGINWICGLDIAIRAFNIALGLIYFDGVSAAGQESATRLLWAHLAYLHERDLHQKKATVNNHQLIAALLQHGLLHLFDKTSTAEWRRSSGEIICREMERQFHNDGGNFESALLYHQFVLEAVYVTAALIAADPVDTSGVPATLAEHLLKSTRFTGCYTKTWSGVPQIGDSSDGRILIHKDYFSWSPDDNSYLSDWSRLILADQDPFRQDALHPGAQLFAETGLGAYRTTHYGVLLSAMPVAANAAGHNHLDKTGVLLQIQDTPVLVDSGTYCYTSDTAARYAFREGAAHNVMLLGKHDQTELNIKEAFAKPSYRDVGVSLTHDESGDPIFESWHDGYSRLAGRGKVSRRLQCAERALTLHDAAEGQGDEFIRLIFNIHPGITVEQVDDHVLLSHGGMPLCIISPPQDWRIALEAGVYSSRYTFQQACPRVVFSRTVSLPFAVETTISIL